MQGLPLWTRRSTPMKSAILTSGVDPQSRPTYYIVWAYVYTLMLFEKMTECFKNYEERLNVEIDTMTAESDIDRYLINIETLAEQGTDGFLIHIDVATKDRIVEVLDETGLPYVALFNTVRDGDGNNMVPTVGTRPVQRRRHVTRLAE